MIPETSFNQTVEVYRCRTFPDAWVPESILLEGLCAVDATLYRDPSQWWMFVNIAPEGARHAHDELHLFHAPSPFGPWTPHRRNPVKSDARSARPAGRLFHSEGRLLRPAQDCSRRYGHAIVLNEVRRLDRSCFEEVAVARILPEWRPDLLATHTFNREGQLTVVDGMRRISPFRG